MPIGYPSTNGNGNGNGTATKPRKEAIAGGLSAWGWGSYAATSWGDDTRPIYLPHAFDDVTRDFRVEVYEWMMCDPVVSSSVVRIKQSVLAGGVRVRPSDKYQAKPGEKESSEQKKAKEIADWVQRNVERMETPLPDVLNEMLDCLVYGHVLAEIVYQDDLVDGKRALRDVKPKPLSAYRFAVDRFGNILWIEPTQKAGLPTGDERIEREHFVLLTWGKRRGDPRGQSILRPAYRPWNDKRQLVTDYLTYAKRFASPSIVGRFVAVDGPNGKTWDTTATSANSTALEEFVASLETFKNGAVLGLGAGRDVEVFEAVGNGDAFLKGFDYWDRQIAAAIVVSARATMEAQNSSKADAEVASRNPDALAEFLSDKAARAFEWDLFYHMVLDAFGEKAADEFTPCLEVGASEQQDIPGEMAVAVSAGYALDPSQFEALDAKLGMPERAEGWNDQPDPTAPDGGGGVQYQDENGNPVDAQGNPLPADPQPPAGGPPEKPKPKTKPATFAAAAPAPWDESDLRSARVLLNRALGTAARRRRWMKGTLSPEERRAALRRLADLARGRLRAEGEALTRTLAPAPADTADFALSGTLVAWRDATAQYLRRVYLAGTLALIGPDPNAADYAALRQANEGQIAYLDQFAEDVASGRQALDGTLAARSAMYGSSAWAVAQFVGRERARAVGMSQERRVHVGMDRPCAGCTAEVGKAWQPVGTLKPIGACECMSGCHCHFEYRDDNAVTFARGGAAAPKAGMKAKAKATAKGQKKTHARTPGVCGPGGGAPCHKARAAKKAAVTPAQKARARTAAVIVRKSAKAAKKAKAVVVRQENAAQRAVAKGKASPLVNPAKSQAEAAPKRAAAIGRMVEKSKAAVAAARAKAGPADGFPASPSKLQAVKSLGGSTGATLVKDPTTGKQFVMKKGASADHLREEAYADAAYRALGVKVPASKIYQTKDGPVKLAEFVEGRTLADVMKSDPALAKKAVADLKKGFAADVLLGNRDVIGLNSDNILVTAKGEAFRADNGGSFRFRAQGGKKGDFDQHPADLWTLRDKTINASAAAVFGKLGIKDIAGQVAKLPTDVSKLGLPPELAGTVQARLDQLKDIGGTAKTLLKDKFKEPYTDRFLQHTVGLRKAGISERMPAKLTQKKPGSEVMVDENGVEYDHLRGKGSLVGDFEAYVQSSGGNPKAIGKWMEGQAGSSWSPMANAFKAHIAKNRDIPESVQYWPSSATTKGESSLKDAVQLAGGQEKYDQSMAAAHAFTHEYLKKAQFDGKDAKAGTVTLYRTIDSTVLQNAGLKKGDMGVDLPRKGIAESASILGPVSIHGSIVTVQKVPIHRVLATYWQSRPGASSYSQDKGALLGDHEKEFVAMLDGIKFDVTKPKAK